MSMLRVLKILSVAAALTLLLPTALAQCVSSVPATLQSGSSACIKVCAMEGYPAIQLEGGSVNGPQGVPVLEMRAGCAAGTTPCNATCTAVTPPELVLGGDIYYPDQYYGENECFAIYMYWMHDQIWALEIFTFCDGCFCLTYDHQLPVEMRSPFTAVAGDGEVTLQWTTASESNNDHFNILRGGEPRAMLPGLGSSAVGRSYVWTDADVTAGTIYDYTLEAADAAGNRREVGTASAMPRGSAGGVVTDYALYQNYPNPFNPATQIAFDVKEAAVVRLRVFNPLGEDVALLLDGELGAGHYEVPFDAAHLPTGLYFYTITIGDRFSATRKMLLVK